MTANIFGERFLGVREPAWHKLGITPETSPQPYEGLQMIDGDFEIVKAPLSATVETLFGKTTIEVPGKYAIVREPTSDSQEYAVFGTCAGDYEIIQRRDIAHALEKLTDRWPIETIGMLGKGETVFFTLDAGTTSIGGDEVKQYFLVTDTVDGKTSLRISFTPVRVVCQNTLDAGIRAQVAGAALDHRATVGEHLEFHVDLIDKMLAKQVNILEVFDCMTQINLSNEQVRKFFDEVYPQPKAPKKMPLAVITDPAFSNLREQGERAQADFEYYINNAARLKDAALSLFDKFNSEFPQTAGTLWAAYNASVELADWRDGKGDGADASVLFGSRAREAQKAYAVATGLMK